MTTKNSNNSTRNQNQQTPRPLKVKSGIKAGAFKLRGNTGT